MLFGVVPAWQASRPELQSTLKDNTRGSTGDGQRHFARAGLVLAEVSISLVLLVGAGLLFRSLMTLVDMPMGFTTSRMLTMSVAPTGENYDRRRNSWPIGIASSSASARFPAWRRWR